ncbi:hypothetical protein ACP70R_027947 [Stipagrostis hirtigluma subsp. patula]
MGEAAAAAEGLLQRRIEFHGARNPHTAAVAAAAPGGFRMEMLRTDAEKRVAAARSEGGRRFEKGESSGNGFDPELAAARVYLRRIGAGLHNLGNTCYLNSVLQCLTYTEPFVAYLQSGKHKSSCRTTGFCALCALQNHVRSALQSTGKILKPVHFVNNLSKTGISRSFRNSRQEDAHELMVSLLESMHKCCLPSGIPSESPSAYEKSLVHRIFGGRLRSQVRCTRCSHCSNKYDPFLDLSLEIGNATTLMKALQNFTQEEVLDGGEKQYNCQRCKQKVVAKKRIIIDKAPSVLTIHLKRFSPFNPLLKIDKKVDFHPTLNLKPFVSNSEDMDLKYNLYGVLVHAGWNTQSGHYYCFVRTSSGIWHNLDDNQVLQVREADVLRQKAYMLFYVRDTVRSLGMHKNNSAATLPGKSVTPNMTIGEFKKLYGDMRPQKQNPDSSQSSMVSNTSQDQCSSERSKTELIAESSQSNGPASVQNASCMHPDGAASLSAEMKHITSDCKSPGQPGTCILRDASCDQKEFEKPLQGLQPEPDDALTNSGKDVPAVVVPTGNGPDELLGATGQTTDSHTLCDANCDQKACEMPLQELQIGHECTDSGKDIPAAAIPICNDTDGLLGVTGQLTEARTDPYRKSSPDTCILRGASCDQKPCEKTLHELQPELDGTLTDSVKDIPAAAIPVCNGTGGLLGATGQPTEPQTDQLCRSSPDTDTAAIAQTIPTEDAIVSNGTVSSNEDSTIGNEAKEIEPVKQQDELVVMEKLSAEKIDDKGNAENQTSVHLQNNRLDHVQVMVNELSVMDTDHMENAERASVQNNALDIRQVSPERQISSDDSAQVVCSEDRAQVIRSEDSVQVSDKDPCHGNSHKKKDIKSKKHVRYQAVNLFFGSKQLLLGSLKPRNKRKHKRIKRQSKSSVDIESIANEQASTSETVPTKGISCKSHRRKRSRNTASSEDGVQLFNKKQNLGDSSGAAELTEDKKDKDALLASDQQASTSETVLTKGISCKSHRHKRSRNTASSEDVVQLFHKKQNLGDSSGAAELTEDKKDKDALLACAELPSLCPSSVSNSDDRKCVRANESGSRHFDILTRGLREITVPRWDDIDVPNNNVTKLQYSRTTSIGYVLDGWDEEYDRGRRKKARKPIGNFSGPNPFQETANMRSRQRMRPEVELARTGHKPFRI